MVECVCGDISSVSCEVLVNASNGRGYMGGRVCASRLRKGVAESLQFATNGLIEIEAKATVRSFGFFPWVFGLSAGSFFVTSSCGLPCFCVFHAVTMRNPASRSSVKVVRNCLLSLRDFCMDKGFYEVALPMLGCGNGNVAKEDFLSLVDEIFYDDFWKIKVVRKEI